MSGVGSNRSKPEELVQTKLSFQEPNVPQKIKQISFGLMGAEEIINTAEFHVYERSLYKMPERRPQPNGVLDLRLGVSNKRATCETCGQMLADCTGHFGYIALELPVFHIGYFRNTLQILQCICKSCSRVLLHDEDRRLFARRFRSDKLERVRREAVFRRVLDKCKRVRKCPHCGGLNGPVKKAPSSLKVIHDPFQKPHLAAGEEYRYELEIAATGNDQIRQHFKNALDDLNPLRVEGLFRAIPDEDCELLDLASRPENLLLSHIPVPPVCLRPSVEMDAGSGSNEDDLTVKLMQIVEVNNILRHGVEKGLPISSIAENWDFLQVQCAVYINSDLPGVTSMYQVPGKPTRGFVQRLKGKQGRFRGNLSGKRVDFSGRTVISPDPMLSVEEVGVPKLMAMTLTYQERVTEANIEKMRERVLAGSQSHPGANFVILPGNDKVFLKFGDRRRVAADLKVGDLVDRHLEDGDIVLFNRQPSLHRMSIMAHRVRVLEGRTLRFNECVCAPYNADFDGDEMNIHVPQTEEAKAEARELMGVRHNLATPKSGEILIAATQDFLTSAFLLTSKDAFFNRAQACRLASYFFQFDTKNPFAAQIELPSPALVKPVELWTGKQVFSLLLRPNSRADIFVNLETKERHYGSAVGADGKKDDALHMDLADGYVLFRDSCLLSGRLGKGTLGGGNKSGLFQVLSSDYGPVEAVKVMNRLAKLSARVIGEIGFSIGIDDVTPAFKLEEEKSAAVIAGYDKCQHYIQQYGRGKLPLAPGCDADATLESVITGELNSIRERAAAACMRGLHPLNSPLIMSQCGSKGSPINIAQMVACVGQQSVGGRRAPNGFTGRTLPHFPRGDKTPEGKGFVANSFYSGLTPTEFFFHTMAGREGLVDTAVKTAETGYMSRRLMKALEDLYVHYDGSVRNAAGAVVQLRYGEDGMDPMCMEGAHGEPVAFERLLILARAAKGSLQGGSDGDCEGAVADGENVEAKGRARERAGRNKRGSSNRLKSKTISTVPSTAAVPVHTGDATVLLPDELNALSVSIVDALLDPGSIDATIPPSTTESMAAATTASSKRSSASAVMLLDENTEDDINEVHQDGRGRRILCSSKFKADVLLFLSKVEHSIRQTRVALGLEETSRGPFELERLLRPVGLTHDELHAFISLSADRYRDKWVDPGSTVGAFGAQSIGEPGTQMTLKTFHFAGVASMNVTLGVPRLKEIINAARNISTPVMLVELEHRGLGGGGIACSGGGGGGAGSGLITSSSGSKKEPDSEHRSARMEHQEVVARLVKGRLEKTMLSQVAKSIASNIYRGTAVIESMILNLFFEGITYTYIIQPDEHMDNITSPAVKLDTDTLDTLQLELTAQQVAERISATPRLKLKKPHHVRAVDSRTIHIHLPEEKERDREKDDKKKPPPRDVQLNALLTALPNVVVLGIPTVTRAIISYPDAPFDPDRSDPSNASSGFVLYVEGTGMIDVMGTPGVDGTRVKNNNIMEVAHTLGIEAARFTITEQIVYTMEQHGMTIDARHTMLLADCMTNKGEVLGITRFGIAKMKDSVLMLASFEKTTDHLFDAALHGRVDDITGVSESIIMGIPMPTGTGLFKIMQQPRELVEGQLQSTRPLPVLYDVAV